MEILDRLVALARHILILDIGGGRSEPWLFEHSERVMRLARQIARLPEVQARGGADDAAVTAAALFHDAGWAVQARQGLVDRWQLLSRPTNDIQRELGAGLLLEQAAPALPPETLHLAADAIRACNERATELPEAQVLAEAENLDEIGVTYVLRQFRQYQADGRSIEHLLKSWAAQQEYQYWEARIRDGLRFEATRRLAYARLAPIEPFMRALAREHAAADLHVPEALATA